MQHDKEEPVLVAEGLSVDYGPATVFTDVGLTVRAGEFVGLLGPNGAGKTTFMRALLGLVKAHSGVVEVAGLRGKKLRDAVGYVPQRHSVAWDFPIDIYSMVLSGRLSLRPWWRPASREDHIAAAHAIKRVGLWGLRGGPSKSYQAVSVNACSLRVRWRVNRSFCFSTNPSPALTSPPPNSCWSFSASWWTVAWPW